MGTTTNLVLGGSGAIGSVLCRRLKSLGEKVINLDIREGIDLRSASLEGYGGVDYVWFLAWEVGGAKYLTNKKHQLDIIRNNTLICENVFPFLEHTGIPFMFTSSQLVTYENSYGITKILGEQWTKLLGGQIVRLWNVYGWEDPGERSHVIPDLILQGLTGGNISLITNGEEERQFVYVDDCVKNMILTRDRKIKNAHLTNGTWIRIKDLASLIGGQLKTRVCFGTIAGYNNHVDPDSTHLQFTWSTGLQEGIALISEIAKKYLAAKQSEKRITSN